MKNENKKTNATTNATESKNELLTELLKIGSNKKGANKLSRKDFQPVYAYTEQVRKAFIIYNNGLNAGKTESELKPLLDNVFKPLKEIESLIGKINGKKLLLAKVENDCNPAIFTAIIRCFYVDKNIDCTTEIANARSLVKKAKENHEKAVKKADIEQAKQELDKAKKVVRELEKAGENCHAITTHRKEKPFANAFLQSLAIIVKAIHDNKPLVLTEKDN